VISAVLAETSGARLSPSIFSAASKLLKKWQHGFVGGQNLSTFSHNRPGKRPAWSDILCMNAEFLWRLDDLPRKGKFVWVTRNNQPIRWSYLPEGATRFDVVKEFTNRYLWDKAISCQATIMKDGKMIDYWRFRVEPAAKVLR
jgi:hypothetical protein